MVVNCIWFVQQKDNVYEINNYIGHRNEIGRCDLKLDIYSKTPH